MNKYWARSDGRAQSGGWLFFTGKAAASTPAKAYFKAEGLALTRLVGECRLIHRTTRIIERCDEKAGTSYLAYVRANITVKECEKSQVGNDQKEISDKFTKTYDEYDKQQRIERMINYKGGNSKLTKLRSNLNNLLKKKRTTDVQKEIERKKKDLKLLESKTKKKSHRCTDAIDCLIKGNKALQSGNTSVATWAYYEGCYTYRDPELCYAYGTYIKSGGRKSSSRTRTIYNAFKEACSRNHGEACYELGLWEMLQYKDKKVDSKISFKLSCNLGFYKGCVERGYIDWTKYSQTGKKKYLDRAEGYFKKACITLDQPLGCLSSYAKVRFNIPTKENKRNIDTKRQKKIKLDLLKYSCEKKDHLPSCHEVFSAMGGVKYVRNKKTKKSNLTYTPIFKKAIVFLKKNCERGYAKSCGIYAYYLKEYYKKEKESNKLYEKTCNEYKESLSCNILSSHLVSQKKYKEAVKYSEVSCNLNNTAGCLAWGTILEDYLNKYDEAATIYKVACEKKNRAACGRYGNYIADKLNDPVRGLEYTKKGCYYKGSDHLKNKLNFNSSEACVYRAKIEVQKFKKVGQYKGVLGYHCKEKYIRKKAKDMACELFDEISN